MNNNLDVWAIQKYPQELFTALENVKTDKGDLILFTNLECDFILGTQKLKRSFDTSLYYDAGNGNDALILLMKDGIATADQIREYLQKQGLKYHEVTFYKGLKEKLLNEFSIPYEEEKEDENIPELWFAREEYVLKDALNDSIEKGNTTCDYYPALEGILSLNYISNERPTSFNVDGRKISGVIALEDKMILMINNGNDPRNLNPLQVQMVMDELNVSANIHSAKEFDISKPYQSKVIKKHE